MSETSEKIGRCRKQFEESYADNRNCVPRYAWITADAIDRLAADVEAIKAKVDAVSPEDVRHFVEAEKAWVALVTEQRDAAIRERDTAMAEVERLKADCDQLLQDARGICERCKELASMIFSQGTERRAEVARMKAELAARQADGNSPKTSDSSPAAPQPAAPAAGWLTDEERHILGAHLQSLRDQRRAMERGGQTLGYSADPCGLKREADVIDNLLARAGSPPVVEVPAISRRDVPMQNEALAYRDAMNKAGVKWKEVGRE